MYFLVINLGLRSNRVIVFNEKREKVFYDWYPVRTTIKGDWVEQDPNEWWYLTRKLIKKSTEKDEIRKNLKAITVTSSACCLVCLGFKGNVLINSYLVSDKRSAVQAEKIKRNPHFKNIFSRPNNLAAASFMVPKMLWIKKNQPQLFGRINKFMSSNDFLIYKLTGYFFTDTLNAEKFYYNSQKNRYPKEIFELLGIKNSNLPRVVMPGTKIGQLSKENKKYFGFEQNVDVVISTYDAICGFWGSGVSKQGEACNICGTVSSFRTYSEHRVDTDFGILSQRFGREKIYIIGGSNNIDGGLLEWSKNVFYGDNYPEEHVYRIMEYEADQSGIGAENLFFIPYILGERVPFFDTEIRGIFFGLERYHTRHHIMRSIFESSGFMIYDIMNHIEKIGLKVKNIRMSGKLAKNGLICKIRADITNKKVFVVDESETTALGAFMIMAIAYNIFHNFKEASEIVKYRKVYSPRMNNHRKYNKLFDFYKKIYYQNKPLFKERNELIKGIKEVNKSHILDNL